ncbi:protein Flattop [Boleophthalmus pectinirostris]|uniref:protein Flattop n=1 Tax=Boleophthalmus pectinirostris TaxID=150288 RepID=UPI00242BE514|nr:protein Flattop [Boleophthalmus pectinirostris]
MSSRYSANQYENAFKSQRLQNWCQPKQRGKERPSAKLGHTSFIVDDRGHLLPGRKQRDSSWPDFKGTWDLPSRIPAPGFCPTARSQQGLERLTAWGFITDTAQTPGGTRRTEGRTEEEEEEGRRSREQPQQEKVEAVQLENTKQTKTTDPDPRPSSAAEREGTPTQKLLATGPRSAVNTPHAQPAHHVNMCE